MSETAPKAPALPDRDALAALVEAVAAGRDRSAFAELFTHFAPRIKGYMIRLGAEPAQAEELTQDAMLTVWRKAYTFDRRQASVSTWLFTIARNRRIDILRREGRPEFDPNDPLLVPDPAPAPDSLAQQAQREERLRRAMTQLPSEQLDLLQRAFFSGRSHRDIAGDTGLPLGTVKSRLRLAFGHLRRALEEDR
ncbi:MAG: sigma-70 family RNA polymerase sigma factor [Alphaproteobacteria bacterium]